MTTEGHFCGPDSCIECGEIHSCICGLCEVDVKGVDFTGCPHSAVRVYCGCLYCGQCMVQLLNKCGEHHEIHLHIKDE